MQKVIRDAEVITPPKRLRLFASKVSISKHNSNDQSLTTQSVNTIRTTALLIENTNDNGLTCRANLMEIRREFCELRDEMKSWCNLEQRWKEVEDTLR